jgi:hypothetical protein
MPPRWIDVDEVDFSVMLKNVSHFWNLNSLIR